MTRFLLSTCGLALVWMGTHGLGLAQKKPAPQSAATTSAPASTSTSTSAKQASGSSASDFIRSKQEGAVKIMKLPGRTEAEEQAKQQKLDELLGGFLDYPMLAERSLGSHWKTKTPAERQEFIDLLTRLIHKNYQKHLRGTLSFKIQYKAEAPLPEGVLVTTVARSLTNKRAEPVTIEYAVRPAGTDWKVFDITTDGVSMVRNYRTQFHKILVKDGWGELIGRMKKRLAENKDDVV